MISVCWFHRRNTVFFSLLPYNFELKSNCSGCNLFFYIRIRVLVVDFRTFLRVEWHSFMKQQRLPDVAQCFSNCAHFTQCNWAKYVIITGALRRRRYSQFLITTTTTLSPYIPHTSIYFLSRLCHCSLWAFCFAFCFGCLLNMIFSSVSQLFQYILLNISYIQMLELFWIMYFVDMGCWNCETWKVCYCGTGGGDWMRNGLTHISDKG